MATPLSPSGVEPATLRNPIGSAEVLDFARTERCQVPYSSASYWPSAAVRTAPW